MTRQTRAGRTFDARRCAFGWCVTEHGSTAHPDDEDHRSAGVGVSARVRDAVGSGPGIPAEVEVGLLRRTTDSETWVIVETGIGASVSLPVSAVRELAIGLQEEGELAALLAPESAAP